MPTPPPAFHVMVKPRGAVCNLDCAYCFYLTKEQLFPESSFRMSDAVLESFTRQYIQAQRVPEVTFAWQGGEPTLMGLEFFERAVALQQQYCPPGMKISNSFQTNATLIDDEWARFFRRHNFLLGVSLDGPADLHDLYRRDKGGQPTHARVLAGVEHLKRHGVQFNILACVNDQTAQHPLEVYHHFRDEIGVQFIQFIPIVETLNASSGIASSRSVSGRAYGRFLNAVFDEWVRRDVGRVYVQIFDTALGIWSGQPAGLCVFAPTCGTGLALEHTGDLYACDHYVSPQHHLGNIMETPLAELVTSPRQVQFGQDKKTTLSRQCWECPVLFACRGACPKDRILATPQGEPGLNYLCEGYKVFFTHIDAPMRRMAELLRISLPPADIMLELPTKTGRKRH
ncbi:MAG: anaerobic sulfatase maturase [Anaerolineaceae bacterium]|nr:anaerobic sulfatase maturase [Anaerolineaceae bacterium]